MAVGYSLLGGLIRDFVVATVTLLNSRHRWLVVGSGRSGVTTLQEAFQTNSDIIPDLPTTGKKVKARILKAKIDNSTFRFRTADMMNQPEGRHQFLEEMLCEPVGVIFVFKTFNVGDGGDIKCTHLHDKSEFLKDENGFWRHEGDYQQLRFLTNAFLYPQTLESNYPEVFSESALRSSIRQKWLNKNPYVPRILVMVGNFMDITYEKLDSATASAQAESMRRFLWPYMNTFAPLTSQWQRFHRQSWRGKPKAPCSVRYTAASAKYNIGVQPLLTMMRNSTNAFGG